MLNKAFLGSKIVPLSVPTPFLGIVPLLVPHSSSALSLETSRLIDLAMFSGHRSRFRLFRFLFRPLRMGSGRNCVLLEATQFRSECSAHPARIGQTVSFAHRQGKALAALHFRALSPLTTRAYGKAAAATLPVRKGGLELSATRAVYTRRA